MKLRSHQDPSYSDQAYDICVSTTGPGTFILATTAAAFFGINVVATSAGAVIRIYDSISAASGNIVWQGTLAANASTESGRFSKVQARKGLVLFSTLSTGASAVVYYGPKG